MFTFSCRVLKATKKPYPEPVKPSFFLPKLKIRLAQGLNPVPSSILLLRKGRPISSHNCINISRNSRPELALFASAQIYPPCLHLTISKRQGESSFCPFRRGTQRSYKSSTHHSCSTASHPWSSPVHPCLVAPFFHLHLKHSSCMYQGDSEAC